MNQINDIDPDINFTNDAECSYFSSQNIHNILNNNMLNIIHVNIRSCHKNLDEFILLLGNLRVYYSVLILSETWLDSEDDFPEVPGSKSFHCVRRDRRGGGVSILVRSNLSVTLVPQLTCVGPVSRLWMSLTLSTAKYTIVGTYRPTSCSLELFDNVFFTMLRTSPNCSNLLILSDFNVDQLSDTPSGSELSFRDEINTHPLIPLVNIPIRVCPTSATCIDHIYTNSVSPFVSGVLAEPLADHFPIFCADPLIGRRDSDKISIKFRDLGRNSIVF